MRLNSKLTLPPGLGAIIAGALTFAIFFFPLRAAYAPAGSPLLFLIATVPATAIAHLTNLFFNRGLSTFAGRKWGAFVILLIVAECVVAGFVGADNRANTSPVMGVLVAAFAALFLLPGLWVFSMPSSLVSAIPLVVNLILLGISFQVPYFAVVGLAFFMLSGYFFPKHRRLVEFWRPTRLPRIKARRT